MYDAMVAIKYLTMIKNIVQQNITDFTERVFAIVKKIPRGSVMTYREVAEQAGVPHGARAVGNILSRNTDINIPCHRVIRSDGTLGMYNGLQGSSKEAILRAEGY